MPHQLTRKLPMADKLGYGVGNLGYGMIFQIVTSYLVFYSTAVLRVPGSLVGLAVSISIIWDAVTDPVVGFISDRTYFPGLGRRHGYILLGTILLPVINFLLWSISPELSSGLTFSLVLTFVLMIKTLQTVFSTPHTALGAELTSDYDDRSSVQAIRTIFFLLGQFAATVLGMAFFFQATETHPVGQLNPESYISMGFWSSILMLVMGLLCFFSTRKFIPQLQALAIARGPGSSKNPLEMFRTMIHAFKNRDYKNIVVGYLLTNIAAALIAAVGLHVFTYTFNLDNNAIAIVYGTVFTFSILSQPIWVALAKRFEKKPALMASLGIALLGSLNFLILVLSRDTVSGNYVYLLPFAVLTGFGSGGLFCLPYSMVADTIDVDEWETGSRNEGVFYGSLTLAYKLSQSIAIFLLGILLDVIGFNPTLSSQPVVTVLTLGLVVAVGGMISLGAAIPSYSRYSLNKDDVLRIQNQIKERAQAG